ncbi:MAG: Zinc ribbon domain protein [Syntrophorhabdus sp. PtaU1.Bin153]|nr:MAG: Zinc ribbon domain protein [Syntrophorhabdus sp. PtaU1.Bin153]
MPTYDYRCEACGHEFSVILSITEHESGKITCPQCKGDKVTQLMSVFTPKTSRKS